MLGAWPYSPLPIPQLMQQQAALVAAHSAYLSPMATMAAVQMQHMAAINANGLIATPITPSSGKACAEQVGLGRNTAGQIMVTVSRGSHGVQEVLGSENGRLLHSAPRCASWFSASVCLSLLCRYHFLLPRNQHPSCHCCHARLCHPCCLGRQRLQPGAHPARRAACPRCSVSQRGSPLPRWGSLPAHLAP